jgi:hypothetical protein
LIEAAKQRIVHPTRRFKELAMTFMSELFDTQNIYVLAAMVAAVVAYCSWVNRAGVSR